MRLARLWGGRWVDVGAPGGPGGLPCVARVRRRPWEASSACVGNGRTDLGFALIYVVACPRNACLSPNRCAAKEMHVAHTSVHVRGGPDGEWGERTHPVRKDTRRFYGFVPGKCAILLWWGTQFPQNVRVFSKVVTGGGVRKRTRKVCGDGHFGEGSPVIRNSKGDAYEKRCRMIVRGKAPT